MNNITANNRSMVYVDTDGDDESILAVIAAADPGAILVPSRPKLKPPRACEIVGDEECPRFFVADMWPHYREGAERFADERGGHCEEVPDFDVSLSVNGVQGLGMEPASVWALRAGHVLAKIAGREYDVDDADFICGIWGFDDKPPPTFPITDDADELGLVASAVVWAVGDGLTIRRIVARLFESDADWPRETLTIFDVELALRMLGFVERENVWSRP